MNINALGDINQTMQIANGVRYAEALCTSNVFRAVAIVVAFGSFMYYLYGTISRRNTLLSPLMFMIFGTLIATGSMRATVPVTAGSTASVQLKQSIEQLRQAVESGRQQLLKIQASPNLGGAAAEQSQLSKDQAKLSSLEKNQNKIENQAALAHAPSYLSDLYTISNGVGRGVWAAVSKVTPVNPNSREWQVAISSDLSRRPASSPFSKQAANAMMQCYTAKYQLAVDQNELAKLRDLVHSNRFEGEAGLKKLYANGTTLQDFKKMESLKLAQAKKKCSQANQKLLNAIKVSPSERQDFLGQHSVLGFKWQSETRSKMMNFLAGEFALSPQKMKSMSKNQLANLFVKYKKLEAVSQDFADSAGKQAGGTGTGQTTKASGVKSSVSGYMTDFVSGFLKAARPYVSDTISWGWFFVMLSFPAIAIASLLPKFHFKAPMMFFLACLFLSLWSVTNGIITSYVSNLAAEKISGAPKAYGVGAQIGDTIDQIGDDLGGSSTASNTMGAGGVALGAFRLPGVAPAIAGSVELIAGTTAGTIALPATLLTGAVMLSGSMIKMGMGLDQNQQKFIRQLNGQVPVSPIFQAIGTGQLRAQRSALQQIQDRLEVEETLLLLFSPILTFLVFFLGYKGAASANLAAPIMAVAGAAASSVSSMAMSNLNRAGGRGAGSRTGSNGNG